MFKNLKIFLGKNDFNIIFFILLLSFLSAFVEILVINSLALFVTLLVNTKLFLNSLPIEDLKIYLSSLNQKDLIYQVSYFILFIVLFKSIFITIINYFEISFFSKIKLKNSQSLFSYYVTRNYDYYLNKYLPEMLSNSFHEMERAHTYLIQIFACLREILLAVLIFYVLFTKSFMITSICFAVFSLLGFIYFFLIKDFLARKSKETSYYHNKLFNILTNALEDIKFIKVINCEEKYINNHNIFQDKVVNAEKLSTFFSRFPRTILELFGILIFVISIFYFLEINSDTSSIVAELSIFGFAILRLIPIFSVIVSNATNIRYFHRSFLKVIGEISKYKDDISKIKQTQDNRTNIDKNLNNIKDISLKDINYKYQNSSETVLKDVSLDFQFKKITGISGHSGSGKSTLIGVLLGLLKPSKGKINFNFQNDYSTEVIPKNTFGYVPQNIFLMDDTIKRNIALGVEDEKIDEKKVIESLKQANIYELFNNSQNKLDTNLGYRGLKLSGGQIQRIGIARALYFNPKFIVLDESTNALDKETEQSILKEISILKKTMGFIVISHRESTMSICDKVYKIDKGKII